jgi:DNA primase
VETEGKDFSTPERRAGMERALAEIVAAIGDAKIADYYRRDFDNRVFEEFKRRKPAPRSAQGRPEPGKARRALPTRAGGAGSGPAVSAAVKNSLIAKAGKGGARRLKELEVAVLLWEKPDLALLHGEVLAELPFADRSLDRLRHELLNLAASGGRLETKALENHLVGVGQSELVEQLAQRASGEIASATAKDADRGPADADANADDLEARWLRAAAQLREIAELDPQRARAVERFRNEASEESWREVQMLLERRAVQGE